MPSDAARETQRVDSQCPRLRQNLPDNYEGGGLRNARLYRFTMTPQRQHVTRRSRPAHRSALTHSDYATLAQFRYLLRQFARFSEIAAREVGLTTQQHQALLAIQGFSNQQSLTIGELAERLNLRSHSVVGLVNRLVRRGLVRRRTDVQDARRVRVELSTQGGKLLARLSKVHRGELKRLAPLLKRLIAQLT